jgi:ABC-type amino acid transport substrate-binding protein
LPDLNPSILLTSLDRSQCKTEFCNTAKRRNLAFLISQSETNAKLENVQLGSLRPPLISHLEQYLHQLGWRQADLAAAAHISQAQVSGWFTNNRSIGRSHINRIAWALANGKRKQNNTTQFPSARTDDDFSLIDSLDGLLNQLLTDAGYSAIAGAGQDLIWARLSSEPTRVLRVGWVHYPPFCSIQSSGLSSVPTGLAVDVMRLIANLMGVEIAWHKFEWSELLDALKQRQIDAVCPTLMELPRRLFLASFSEPLPDIHVGLNAVINMTSRNSIRVTNDRKLDPGNLFVGFVEGEIGETLHTYLAPGANVHRYTTFQEAADDLRKTRDDSKIGCVVADHLLCKSLVREHPGDLTMVFTEPQEPGDHRVARQSGLKLTVAAAVHLDEPKLLRMINSSLRILQGAGYFEETIYRSKFAGELRTEGVLSSADENVTQPDDPITIPAKLLLGLIPLIPFLRRIAHKRDRKLLK